MAKSIEKSPKLIASQVEAILDSNSLDIVLDSKSYKALLKNLIDYIDEVRENWQDTVLEEAEDKARIEGEEAGLEAGRKEALEDEDLLEKANVFYTVEKFSEVKTMDDFKELYLELTRRSCNFM